MKAERETFDPKVMEVLFFFTLTRTTLRPRIRDGILLDRVGSKVFPPLSLTTAPSRAYAILLPSAEVLNGVSCSGELAHRRNRSSVHIEPSGHRPAGIRSGV